MSFQTMVNEVMHGRDASDVVREELAHMHEEPQPSKTVEVKLTGHPETVDKALAVLGHMQRLCGWGSSRDIMFHCDGDGHEHFKVDGRDWDDLAAGSDHVRVGSSNSFSDDDTD